MDAPKNYDIKTIDEILGKARSMIGRQKNYNFVQSSPVGTVYYTISR